MSLINVFFSQMSSTLRSPFKASSFKSSFLNQAFPFHQHVFPEIRWCSSLLKGSFLNQDFLLWAKSSAFIDPFLSIKAFFFPQKPSVSIKAFLLISMFFEYLFFANHGLCLNQRHFFFLFFSQSIFVNQRLLFESRLFSLSMRHAWGIGNWQPTLATNWSPCLSAREAKVCLRKSVCGGQFVFGGKFVCGKSVTLQHKFVFEMVFGCAGKKSYTQCRHNATFTWTDAKALLLCCSTKETWITARFDTQLFLQRQSFKNTISRKIPAGLRWWRQNFHLRFCKCLCQNSEASTSNEHRKNDPSE